MDIDPSDIVAINSDDDDEIEINSEKPIIQLFKRLITSDSKQNTVLTNAQIVEILSKEFNINISELHELEGDIYLTIMKKYLKDWPQWDEFDHVITNLKIEKKKHEMENIFEEKYINLKSYLKTMLDVAQTLAKESLQKLLESKSSMEKENQKSSESSVVLEITASRCQLNQLFFRQPNPDLNDTLFNPTYLLPTQITLTTIPIEAILNWWGLNIIITNTSNVSVYKREAAHELKHTLINKKVMSSYSKLKVLDQDIKVYNQPTQRIETATLIKVIDQLGSKSADHYDICEFIKKDLRTFPEYFPLRLSCKRYTNKYPYKRYLYQNVNNADTEMKRKFDIKLEEILSPCYLTYVSQMNDTNVTLAVFCERCEVKFSGDNLILDLKAHFNERHQNEKDWKCMNCEKRFPMVELAQNWWCHRC